MATSNVEHPKVVSRAEWLAARKELLAKEKEFTHQRDALSAERRQLPWVKVDKQYAFDSPSGKKTLADLFAGKSQLIVYHFMLAPGWTEGCKGCSYVADHFDGPLMHLPHRDVTLTVVSRAPLAEIEAFKKRMGWRFPWVSSNGNEFNHDYKVSFTKEEMESGNPIYNFGTIKFTSEEGPGASVFYKDAKGNTYHTYSTYGRGLDILLGTYNFLDMVPKGRDEQDLPASMAWLRHHDKYVDQTGVQGIAPAEHARKASS